MTVCTLTQGKIAVKSLSYLKRFRRRFSGELQPKAHSLTRFAAWEISSISQKIHRKHGTLLHVLNFSFVKDKSNRTLNFKVSYMYFISSVIMKWTLSKSENVRSFLAERPKIVWPKSRQNVLKLAKFDMRIFVWQK